MKKKSIVLLCAIALILSGCGSRANPSPASSNMNGVTDTAKSAPNSTKDKNAKPLSKESDSANADEESPVRITYKSDSIVYKSDDGKKDIFYTTYCNPTVTIKERGVASKKINDFLSNEKKIFDDGVTAGLADAKSLYTQKPDLFNTYSSYRYYEEQRCDKQVISLKCNLSDYMSGAHDDYGYMGYNFDTKTGKQLTLADISSNQKELTDSARNYINSQLKLPGYSKKLMNSLEQCQDIINTNVITDGNWYFSKTGLTFVSNPYVLGSYAAGAFFFTVPYQQLDGLKADYQYTGNFVMSAPVGSTMSADLNGDESMDAIYFDAVSDDTTGKMKSALTINGKDFSSVLQAKGRWLSYGASSNCGQQYYLIDLDASDKYKELAIQDEGESNNPQTYFYRYNGKQLNYLGSIYDLLSNSTTKATGDGTVSANLPIHMLETLSAKGSYKLDDNKLSLVPQDWYTIDYSTLELKYQCHNLLKSVSVYTKPDTQSDKVLLTSDNDPVTFPATDNKHWFKIKTNNGKLYYLYMKDFSTLDSGDDANSVFDNLFQAG